MNRPLQNATVRLLRTPPEGAEVLRAIPENFPMPDFSSYGAAPSSIYAYRTLDGALAGLIARTETASGKSLLPATVWVSPDGRREWYLKAWPDTRPLYRQHTLATSPSKTVLISEGEKCAEALTSFDSYCSVTWSGGSNALTKTDFSPLAGRDVIILPDHDEAGAKVADKLTRILQDLGATSIRRIDIAVLARLCKIEPEPGFDIADAIEQGLNEEGFRDLLDKPGIIMTPALPAADKLTSPEVSKTEDPVHREIREQFDFDLDSLPRVFSLSSDGLIKHDMSPRGMPIDVYAGSPLLVLGRTRDDSDGQGWGHVVALRTPDGTWQSRVIPARLLAGDGKELRELLADAGATLPQGRAGRQAQAEFIAYAQTGKILQLASRPGWHRSNFALPHEIIRSKNATEDTMIDMGGRKHFLRTSGSFEDWQKLAALAEPNSRAAFAICAALAAPLLGLLGRSGMGFHFFGRSSRGKTTVLQVGGSVWGGGGTSGFTRNWRMTSNGAEGLLADHNDLLFALDELTLTDPDQARELFYMLADGHGKARANRNGRVQEARQSRVILLSSGENAAAQQLGLSKGKARMTGGAAVRMVDIPIECAPDQSFEDLAGAASAGALAEVMSRMARSHYGHAGPAFLRAIVDRKEKTVSVASEWIDNMLDILAEADDDPQIRRVAAQFGLVAAAGELAMRAGILPWKTGTASLAATRCFRDWKAYRGGGASHEERDALTHLRSFFEAHGRTRFERLQDDGEQTTDGMSTRSTDMAVRDRCGYRLETEAEGTTYYILPEAFRTEVCGTHNPDLVVQIAKARGALIPGENGRPQKKMRLPDYPRGIRVYALRPDLLTPVEE